MRLWCIACDILKNNCGGKTAVWRRHWLQDVLIEEMLCRLAESCKFADSMQKYQGILGIFPWGNKPGKFFNHHASGAETPRLLCIRAEPQRQIHTVFKTEDGRPAKREKGTSFIVHIVWGEEMTV